MYKKPKLIYSKETAMARICCALALSLVLLGNVTAQTTKKTTSKPVVIKKAARVVTMSDLASKHVCVDPTKHTVPVDGVIVKRNFDDNEMTLIGVVVREKDDQRYFVNIDSEYVAGKGRWVPSELSSILTKGRRVKIWVYGCGAAGMMFWARTVKAY